MLKDYEGRTAVDFVIRDESRTPRVIGFAHYDSDRGGAQEYDRANANRDGMHAILAYSRAAHTPLAVVFVNDGPGLLLGSMWKIYADIEAGGDGHVLVTTLKMAQAGRFTAGWIERSAS